LRLMGSEVHVDTALGKGSRFWFDLQLPLADSSPRPVPRSPRVTGYAGPRKTVLVVDDQDDNRAMLVELFDAMGFETLEASDGAELLERAAADGPDLIVTDIAMPVMDGIEAIRRLRTLPTCAHLPVIAVSAHASMGGTDIQSRASADAYLNKPVDIAQLLQEAGRLLKLQWMSEQPRPGKAAAESMVMPPREEIEVLYRLAKGGNMRSIRARADHVRAMGSDYEPFARQLQVLADEFQSMAIVEFITAHRHPEDVAKSASSVG
jgi:CheY-like chemotaxis protein